MKTYFDDPVLRVIRFEARDVLTTSSTETAPDFDYDDDELPIMPGTNP